MASSLMKLAVPLFTVFYVTSGQGQNTQYPITYGHSSQLKGASQACVVTFNEEISCPSMLNAALDRKPSTTELDGLCTTECFESLVNHRNNVVSTCDSTVTYDDEFDGSHWPLTYLTDLAIYHYNLTCLKQSNGEYCGPSTDEQSECDECHMRKLHLQAESPLSRNVGDLEDAYTAMIANCEEQERIATRTVNLAARQASTTAASFPTPTRTISMDGTCGAANNQGCLGSEFGNCCSANGWCGPSVGYCGPGCQREWGGCNNNLEKTSPDGTCGPNSKNQYTCLGSAFGLCCSEHGWCGDSPAHCDRCIKYFGVC